MTTTSSAEPTTPSRRDRQRAATEAEIKAAARRQLGAEAGVSLRGIAREMGMTAPGLYRYFSSLDDLLDGLCCEFFAEASDAVADAIAAAGPDVADRMHAAVRTFRRWALDNPDEFTLMFRLPADHQHEKADDSARFASLFLELFVILWADRAGRPDVGRDAQAPVPEAACRQIETFARLHPVDLPVEALWAFARAWVRLYGVICMEIFGQLRFMFDDVEPYFEAELRSVVGELGVAYRAPTALA